MYVEQLWGRMRPKLDVSRCVEVRSEDLVHNPPPEELGRICALFGLDYVPLLSFADSSTYELPGPSLCYQRRRKLLDREMSRIRWPVGLD